MIARREDPNPREPLPKEFAEVLVAPYGMAITDELVESYLRYMLEHPECTLPSNTKLEDEA